METRNKIINPFKNEIFKNQIEQTCQSFAVVQTYYHPKDSKGYDHLFIITDTGKDADSIREKKWIKTALLEEKTKIYVSTISRIEYQLKKGYPLVQYFCHPSLLTYSKNPGSEYLKQDFSKRKQLKKYRGFKESFYHDHDILKSEANGFYHLGSPISTFITYAKLIEHDLDYLEYVYTGNRSNHQNLHYRIKNLIAHIPGLQKLLVRKSENTYFLISKLEAAVEAAQNCDEMYIKTELYSAIQSLESALYQIIDDRLKELKDLLRSERPVRSFDSENSEIKTDDKVLEVALATIKKMSEPEEIFLFHKADTCEKKMSMTLYYLLIIGEGIGNDKIIQIQESIKNKTNHSAAVVIISHSRITVQEHLFNYQYLMKQIMTDQNRIFTSSEMHPYIHWEEPFTVEYGDMDLYYSALKGYIVQYFWVRKNIESDNRYGLISVFSNCLMRAMRVFLYGALHSYMPHYLNTFSIWKLCVFADPSIGKIEYLFLKLDVNFYRIIDKGLKFSDHIDHYAEEKLLVMDEILNSIMKFIKTMIEDKQLENK